MPYIGRDGRVMERQSPWRLSIILDLLHGIWAFIIIFFKSMTTSKDRLPEASRARSRTTYAQRQGIRRPNENDDGSGSGASGARRSNIRGMRNLGTAQAPCGGGG